MNIKLYGVKSKSTTLGEVEYPLKKYTAILGANGSGKSTIFAALQAAIFGVVPEDFKNVDSTDSAVSFEFPDGLSTVRTIVGSDGKVDHKIGKKKLAKKEVNAFRKEKLHIEPETAELLSRPGQNIFDQKPEDFAKLLGEIMPKVETEKLEAMLSLSAEERTLLEDLYSGTEINFGNIKDLFKILSEKLKAKKEEVNAAEAGAAALTGKLSGMPLADLKYRQQEITDRLRDSKAAEAERKSYEEKVAAYNAATKEIEEIMEALKKRPAKTDPEVLEKLLEQERYTNKEHLDLERQLQIVQNTIATNQKLLANIESSVCPLSSKLVCTTDKTPLRTELEKVVKENTFMVEVLQSRLSDNETALKIIQKDIHSSREKEKEERSFLLLDARLEALKGQVREYPKAPAKGHPEDIEVLTQQLNDISAEIAAYENVEKAKELKKKAGILAQERDLLAGLREKFAPKGEAYSVIMRVVCGTLTDEVNREAKELGVNYEYDFRVENGMTLYGKTSSMTSFIPVKSMSTGERFIAQLLMNTLFQSINGCPFIILDNIDCLDKENLKRVLALVMSEEYEKKFELVVLSGVNHADTEDVIDRVAAGRTDTEVIKLA